MHYQVFYREYYGSILAAAAIETAFRHYGKTCWVGYILKH